MKYGIAGVVIVGFSIDEKGKVFNSHIIDEQPKGYFGEAALISVKLSRYKPRVVDGKPVIVENKSRKVTFVTQGSEYLTPVEL